jgi:hypothetical protein
VILAAMKRFQRLARRKPSQDQIRLLVAARVALQSTLYLGSTIALDLNSVHGSEGLGHSKPRLEQKRNKVKRKSDFTALKGAPLLAAAYGPRSASTDPNG